MSKEEFDRKARKLLSSRSVGLHNQFLLAMLSKCQATTSNLVVQDHSRLTTQSDRQPSIRLKMVKRKPSSQSTSGQTKFEPADALKYVSVVQLPKDGQPLSFCSEELVLPDVAMIQGRLYVTAWEYGLNGVDNDVIQLILLAAKNFAKDIISAVISQRKSLKVREDFFKHSVGAAAPTSFLHSLTDRSDYEAPADVDIAEGYVPAYKKSKDSQLGAASSSAGGEIVPCRGPITAQEVFHTLMAQPTLVPLQSVYTPNMERLSASMRHATEEEEAARRKVIMGASRR